MSIKLPFGLKNGKLLHVTEVERGLACGCFCPSCNSPLEARRGPIREAHFAHVHEECGYGYETALHRFAKETLMKYKRLKLPQVIVRNRVLYDERTFIFDNVKSEKNFNNIRPDVVLYKNSVQLFVEIKVFHAVDEEKLKKLKELGTSIIEIDISHLIDESSEFNREQVETYIIENTDMKMWLFNKKAEQELVKITKAEEAHRKALEEKKKNEELLRAKALESKEIRVKMLLDPDNQRDLKSGWEREFVNSKLWKRTAEFMKLTPETVPNYFKKDIEGDIVFACDKRIWQSRLFNSFIRNRVSNGKNPHVFVKHMIEHLKRQPNRIPLNWDLVYLKDLKGFCDRPSLTEVVVEYLLNLCNYGFLKKTYETEILGGHCYNWAFEILHDKLKFLPQEFKSEDYMEKDDKLICASTGEFIGYLRDIYK